MSYDKEFDELARRKLGERTIAFDEAHWLVAQRMLGERKERRRRLGMRFGAAAFILLIASAWWWWPGSGNTPLAEDRPSDSTMDHRSTGPTPAASTGHDTERRDAGTDTVRKQATMEPAPRTTNGPGDHPIPAPAGRLRLNEGVLSANSPADAHARMDDGSPVTMAATALVVSTPGNTAPMVHSNVRQEATTGTADGMSSAATAPSGISIAPDPVVASEKAIPEHPTTTPSPEDATIKAAPAGAVPDDMFPDTGPAEASGTLGMTSDTASSAYAMNLLTGGTGQAAGDSITSPVEPPLLESLVPHAAPWEIGVLVGSSFGYSRYADEGGTDRAADVDPLWSPMYGLEAMHMGRNFGIGSGFHFGTYAERLTADPIDRTSWNTSSYWTLGIIDTTILYIVDTVQVGGEVFYNSVQTNVSIPVLTEVTDSVASTVRARDALRSTNRVSYLEIPLLLDAHLVQGRWSLGLRGGPTLGILTGRQGAVPNSTNDGYVSLPDLPFREVVPGYTARAYVRFRFNAGWSVGLEPMVRGQFGNTLQSGDLSRRSSAWGGLIGLTYRLK